MTGADGTPHPDPTPGPDEPHPDPGSAGDESLPDLDPAGEDPRPGSRAARFRLPLARKVVEAVAVENGVRIRPLAIRKVDLDTGETETIPAPCGATLASICPPCAERARRLRMAQCTAGWHLDDEPLPDPDPPSDEAKTLATLRADLEAARVEADLADRADDVADVDDLISQVDEALNDLGVRGKPAPDNRDRPRRTRSTRRRQDAPDLPRLPVDRRTVGRTYAAPDGTVWRPSMFLVRSGRRWRGHRTPISGSPSRSERLGRELFGLTWRIRRAWAAASVQRPACRARHAMARHLTPDFATWLAM